MSQINDYFASCAKQLEPLLHDELESLECTNIKQTAAGVHFSCDLETLYRVCLGSRLANRVLMPIAREKVSHADAIYRLVYETPWESYFSTEESFIVNFVGSNASINNTQYGAQRVKDAIVDRFMSRQNKRPSVDKSQPDVRINVRLTKHQTVLSFDMSGESLHRRYYRQAQGKAPLKETLAAAALIRAGWPELVTQARADSKKIALVDPMCGSGTLLIEAALMAADIAPGMLRTRFGFEKLSVHDQELWQRVTDEVRAGQRDTFEPWFPIFLGADSDSKVVEFAKENVRMAKFDQHVTIQSDSIHSFRNPLGETVSMGLVICNPPYGERLGDVETLRHDYRVLGQVAKNQFPGWNVAVLTSNVDLGREMRLRPESRYKFFNGALPTELINFRILKSGGKLRDDAAPEADTLSEGAKMVVNRLQKNQRKLNAWIKKNDISCYRLYDADMPEYAAAIDVYNDYFHIQEYQAPKSIDENKARKRFSELVRATRFAFNVEREKAVCKTRMRNRGRSQYEKINDAPSAEYMTVTEGKASLLVNLIDYLDTGVFLDHRPLRKRIHESARDKRFLNLFCYTATATVHAALGGAESSVSVDMSNTYLKWAEDNLRLNNIRSRSHQLVRSDVVKWLQNCRQGFDIIMLDPPSFSNSKNTDTVLDIQKDHVRLISRCMEILLPQGELYFSTNLRTFKLDDSALSAFDIEDISAQTLDLDFQRNTKIHRCWKIQS